MITIELINKWLNMEEDEHVEFKEAKNQIDSRELAEYCIALANEGGGHLVLGISRQRPRQLVSSNAIKDTNETKHKLYQQLHLRVEIQEFQVEGKRIVAISVPSRPTGVPLEYKGQYLMRTGESLVGMTPDQLRKIFDETKGDFSAETCPSAGFSDLDRTAVETLRQLWIRKTRNNNLRQLTDSQLLTDAELISSDGGITYAALVLLGTGKALARHLAQAEVVFEYRSSESHEFQQRFEFRKGFLLFFNDLWEIINLRNEMYHYRDGLFVWDIPSFNERVIREAILNAVAHRDYHSNGSVFIRQFPKRMDIVSPGGFPPGITAENILWRQSPRNRRIAETLSKCGLVERSGQGARIMFEECIKESKARPDYSGTDDYQVSLTIQSEVQDERFLRFLECIGRDTLSSFSTEDLLILDSIRREEKIAAHLRGRLERLMELKVIERIGRGRGTRYILSRRLHSYIGDKSGYTRRKGLDRETNIALILKHLDNFSEASIKDFEEVLPNLTRRRIQYLLSILKEEGRISRVGSKRASKWKLV